MKFREVFNLPRHKIMALYKVDRNIKKLVK